MSFLNIKNYNMKKFILFNILIACFSSSYAQEKSFRFGFYGGLNQSYFTNQFKTPEGFNAPEEIGLLGFHLGVVGQKTLSSHFSMNGLFGASQKGTKFKPRNGGFQISYINLATHARFDYKRFFIEAGPEVGFLVDSKNIVEGKLVPIPSFVNLFNQKFDFLANAGIGAWITKTTSVSFRVSKGFLNTMKDINFTDENGTPTGTASFFKNLTYQISVSQMVF
jgi:hypothetical protein